jgi:hypothetical protein
MPYMLVGKWTAALRKQRRGSRKGGTSRSRAELRNVQDIGLEK